MSYHHYETECFVLSSNTEKEANRNYVIFSKDLGLIYAKAQGVSNPSSKLRGNLEPISRAKISLVKGKEVWRIVGAENNSSLWQELKLKREELSLFSRLTALIKRMAASEENHSEIYEVLEECLEVLNEECSGNKLLAIELVAVSRILQSLGYFTIKNDYNDFFSTRLTEIDTEKVFKIKRSIITDINHALKVSHL